MNMLNSVILEGKVFEIRKFSDKIEVIVESDRNVKNSEVKDDIEKYLSGFEFRHAQGFNTGGSDTRSKFYGMTMAEYMRWLWNNPNNGQSPYALFEGVLYPKETDENGDLVYHYQQNRTFIPCGCSGCGHNH